MPSPPSLRTLALAIALCSGSPLAAQTTCRDFRRVDELTRQLVTWVAPGGAVIQLHRDAEEIHEFQHGALLASDVVPIASATKLLSAALILTLWDDGLVDLDAPCSRWLPNYTGLHGEMTLRQMLSHTAGTVVRHPAAEDPTIDLAAAANQLATVPLRSPPGSDFAYGEVSMQIAGRIAEVAGGASWATLFASRIAMPLGMAATDYAATGPTANPWIGGGAQSSVDDYARFLEMLADRGRFRGSRVLSRAAIDELFRIQTRGVPVTLSPRRGPARYGLGCWIDRSDSGGTQQISSPGVFGFWPWIDLERDLAGVLGVFSRYDLVLRYATAIQADVADEVPYAGVECFGAGDPHCQGTPRARVAAPPARGKFDLACDALLPSAAGILVLGFDASSPPPSVGGATLLVAPSPSPYVLPVVADRTGRVEVSVTWSGGPDELPLFAQFLFAPAGPCPGGSPFAGSQGLRLSRD